MNGNYKKWNGNNMIGVTEEDNANIRSWINKYDDDELVVDGCNRLLSTSDINTVTYIADIIDKGDGEGIYCNW
mgnify:CR=1 FL=1|jgi:hypothetical protein